MKPQALSGVKVLDLTHYVAGPFCTKLLADYGAEVLKIERPGHGDEARRMAPFLGDEPDPEKSGLFLFLNTNKRSITLNLKTEMGVRIFEELVKEADVLVENFSPRVMPSLGLDYHSLENVNPSLVMTSISNFGQTGPYRDYKATEIVNIAMSGHMSMLGECERPPVKSAGSQAQFHAGLTGAIATLPALLYAKMAGTGQHVDVSIMEAEMNMIEIRVMYYPYSGEIVHRTGSRIGYYPWGVYQCSDGYVAVSVHQVQWKRAGPWIGRPELSEDPRYSLPPQRLEHMEELERIFLPWFLERTKSEIVSSGQVAGIPVAAVCDPKDMLEDPQYKAREFFVEIDHPKTGKLTYPGAPFRMSKTPWQVARHAPLLGEHNEEVYCGQLGYSRQELIRLREGGII